LNVDLHISHVLTQYISDINIGFYMCVLLFSCVCEWN